MGRILFWLALGALAWFAWRAWRGAQRDPLPRDAPPPVVPPPEPIVQCAHCGVHLPASEAVRSGDAAYCSATHRDAHRSALR